MKKPHPEVTLAFESHDVLGEGSIWNDVTRELYWIDIEGGILHTFRPENNVHQSFSLGQRIGTVVPSDTGKVVLALQDGLYEFDLSTRQKKLIASGGYDSASMRFNDGKCDPAGRLWVGTMHLDILPKVASLYKLEKGTVTEMLDGITISNGICWSEDGKTMYYIDTPTSSVQAFDFDQAKGLLSNSRVVIETKEEFDPPDGMTIDAEGMLWIGHWKGSCVGRWNPRTGKLISKIEVPAYHVTSCAFGGEELDTLYITTASIEVSPEQKIQYPLAGCLFQVKPGVKGVKPFFYKN
jgi:sugar lactone lactonase YvrE